MGQRLKDFRQTLIKSKKVALDTPCFLYHLEKNPKYQKYTEIIFENLLPAGKLKAVASTIVLTETLIRPFTENRLGLVLAYKSIIKGFPNLTLTSVSEKIAQQGAYLRAVYNLHTPDAIHIATAIEENAQAIVGNDKKWKKVKEIKVIILDEFV